MKVSKSEDNDSHYICYLVFDFKTISYLGVWIWQESHFKAPYQNWEPNQPDNSGGGQNCAEILGARGWDDRNCETIQPHALCQVLK